jgi:hypothetical protein
VKRRLSGFVKELSGGGVRFNPVPYPDDAPVLYDDGWREEMSARRLEKYHSVYSRMAELPGLRELIVPLTGLGDDQLRLVARCRQLRRLDLSQSQISDEGLASLAGMKRLRELDVRQTQVTAAGVARLQRALPRLKIIH